MTSFELVSCCLICGSDRLRRIYKGRDSRYRSDETTFHVVECLGCGVGLTTPRPWTEQMNLYYPRDYYRLRGERADHHYRASDGFRERVRRVAEILEVGNVLEIGSANGDLLAALQLRGYEVVGVELDEGAAQYARITYGVAVINKAIECVSFQRASFDLILAWEVLEHLRAPRDVLELCLSWLRPGGYLLLSTPNFDSPHVRRLHRYDLPRHLFHFGPDALRKLATGIGFSVTYIDHRTRICDGSLRGAGVIALRKVLRILGLNPALAQHLFVRHVDEWLVGKPTRWLLPALKLNGYMVVCLRRPLADNVIEDQLECASKRVTP